MASKLDDMVGAAGVSLEELVHELDSQVAFLCKLISIIASTSDHS
jgi:hypothetical protein